MATTTELVDRINEIHARGVKAWREWMAAHPTASGREKLEAKDLLVRGPDAAARAVLDHEATARAAAEGNDYERLGDVIAGDA